jgi:beta-glucanase (GH16 family)
VGDGCDQGANMCGWGNNEWQYYTEGENVEVSDGTLKITAKYDESSDVYTSARITSLSKADFDLTGMLRFEARIRVPYDSQGLWPAFWMLPSLTELSSWPLGGEIDIMEFIGEFRPVVLLCIVEGVSKYPVSFVCIESHWLRDWIGLPKNTEYSHLVTTANNEYR